MIAFSKRAPIMLILGSFLLVGLGAKAQVTVTIDAQQPRTPDKVHVRNNSQVTIRVINKNPFDECGLNKKREELAPEPNVIATILGLVTKAGIAFLTSQQPPDPFPVDSGGKRIPAGEQLLSRLSSLEREFENKKNEIEGSVNRYQGVAQDASRFFSTLFRDEKALAAQREPLVKAMQGLAAIPLPTTEGIDIQLGLAKANLRELHKKHEADLAKGENPERMIGIHQRLDYAVGNLEILKKNIAALLEARQGVDKTVKYLTELRPEFTKAFLLIPDQNAKITGTVTCVNDQSKKVTLDAVPVTVVYEGLPRATLSAGFLLSMLDKRKIGTQPIRTGTAADGTPTFRVVFADVNRADAQIIPFSFVNVRLHDWSWKKTQFTFGAAAGVGVNPNSGTNEAEFFVGPALAIKNFYLHVGNHIGRFQELDGGFLISETVPSGFPATPIRRRYTHRLGIGFSYRIPLP